MKAYGFFHDSKFPFGLRGVRLATMSKTAEPLERRDVVGEHRGRFPLEPIGRPLDAPSLIPPLIARPLSRAKEDLTGAYWQGRLGW
jgi:hypothetical protein